MSDHFPVYGRLTFGRPAARISPPALDFGRVTAVDQPTTHVSGLTVSSVGTGPVTIRGVRVVGPQASAFTVTPNPPSAFPVVLAPRASFSIGVRFDGRTEGSYPARVVVSSDDVEGLPGEFHAVVTGEVIVPDMVVLPMSIAFGPVALGRRVVRNVLITNTGSAPLLFRVEPSPPRSNFSWTGDAIGTRRALRPGDQAVVSVTYEPNARARHTGEVVISGSDGTVRVALSGEGR